MRGAIKSAAPRRSPERERAEHVPPDLTGSEFHRPRAFRRAGAARDAQIDPKSHPNSTFHLTSIHHRFFSDLASILPPYGDDFAQFSLENRLQNRS